MLKMLLHVRCLKKTQNTDKVDMASQQHHRRHRRRGHHNKPELSVTLREEIKRHNPGGKQRPDLSVNNAVASAEGGMRALEFVMQARQQLRLKDTVAREAEKNKHLRDRREVGDGDTL